MPEDLRKLGFIREDAPDSAAIAEPLGRVLSQLSAGGGAKGLNIDQVHLLGLHLHTHADALAHMHVHTHESTHAHSCAIARCALTFDCGRSHLDPRFVNFLAGSD